MAGAIGVESRGRDPVLALDMSQMTEDQRKLYESEYYKGKRDLGSALGLTLLLGWAGGHHFYLKRNNYGAAYLLFFWTGIPFLLSILELFLMPGRVKAYNEKLARGLAEKVKLADSEQDEMHAKMQALKEEQAGVLMIARGSNGQLELLENKIRIRRQGYESLVLHGFKGDKEIFLKHITSVQMLNNPGGYIQFTFMGGQEAKLGAWQATTDENTVMFEASQAEDFKRIKEAIEARVTGAVEAVVPKPELPVTPRSDLDEIEKLASLREKGLISEEEFTLKKRQILGI